MTYGSPPPPLLTPPLTPTRRPIRMLVVGIVLATVGVLGLVVAGVAGVAGTFGVVTSAMDVRRQLVVEVDSPGRATVVLQPGEYVVLALGHGLLTGGNGVSSGAGSAAASLVATPFDVPDVAIAGRVGAIKLRAPDASSAVRTPSLDAVAVHSMTIVTAGEYRIDVTGSGNLVTQIGVRPAVNVAALVRSTAIWVITGAISGLVLLVGVGLIIGGAVRRSRHR